MSDDHEPTAGTSDATADRLFAGRYRLIGRRGTGLDVALFEAVDVLDDRTVAVKIVHPDVCGLPGFGQRFDEIVPRVASIRHPNLAEVLHHGSARWNGLDVRFVVTENLTGGSLRDLRDRGRTLTPSQAVMVGLDVCRALDIAHRAGLVHGDIRPTTLMFGADGRLRVADLGLGSLVTEHQWVEPGLLSIDRAKYASPEQARGEAVGPASDVYALCLCLLESVTGQLPFVGDSTVATLSGRLDKLMPVSADLGPLAAVLERAGRPDPDDRYSAAEFGRALVQAAEKLPRPAPIAVLGGGLFDPDAGSAGAGSNGAGSNGGAAGAAVAMVAGGSSTPIVSPAIVAAEPSVAPAAAAMVNTGDGGRAADRPFAGAVAPPLDRSPIVDEADADAHTHEPLATGPTTDVPATSAVAPSPASPPPPPSADDEASAPLERRGRRRLAVTLAVLLLAFVAGGALAAFLSGTASHTVPELAGVEQGEALNMVSEFGWDVTLTEEFSDDVLLGTVISTDPPAGTSVDEGGDLVLVVSKGPAPRVLPDITGRTVDEANAALVDLGLALQVDQQVFDEAVPAGVVLSWSVPSQPGLVAGDTVLPGTLVSAVVSGGPAPRVVPDLTGLSLADAAAQLAAVDLVLAPLPDEFSPAVPAGGIARQDPAAGTELAKGSTVAAAVSKGPDLVTVPPLGGLTPDQAAQTLAAAGFTVGAIGGDPAGVVVGSSVQGVTLAGGEVFPRGTVVDLVLGVPAG